MLTFKDLIFEDIDIVTNIYHQAIILFDNGYEILVQSRDNKVFTVVMLSLIADEEYSILKNGVLYNQTSKQVTQIMKEVQNYKELID